MSLAHTAAAGAPFHDEPTNPYGDRYGDATDAPGSASSEEMTPGAVDVKVHAAVSVDATPPDHTAKQAIQYISTEKVFVPPAEQRPFWVNALLLVLLIGFGMLEGAAFQRAGVLLPEAIGGQMVFKVWVILKMFIAAVGSSMLFQGFMTLIFTGAFDRSRGHKSLRAGIVRTLIGSTTLGVGMALAGSGPSMLPSQLGAGVEHAWLTLLGALAGGVIFAIVEKVFPTLFATPPRTAVTVDALKLTWLPRYEILAIGGGLGMLGLCLGLEFAVPQWKDERKFKAGDLPWYPIIAGIIVGFNQVPIRLIAGHGQGASTSVMNFIGTATWGFLAPGNKVKSFAQVWQFAFVWVGTSLGAVASAQINKDDFHAPEGYAYWRAFVGGFLMLFGARVAGGCACGNGISGTSELSMESMLAAGCIFGAAIATGFIVQAAGGTMCCGKQM